MPSDTFGIFVGSDTINQSDLLEVKFMLENVEGQIERPAFTGFEIVGGPNQSSSFQFINGKSTSSISHSYWIRATEAGLLYIGPIYATTAQGDKLESGPIAITVMPSSLDEPVQHAVGDQAIRQNLLWQEAPPPKRKLKTRKI